VIQKVHASRESLVEKGRILERNRKVKDYRLKSQGGSSTLYILHARRTCGKGKGGGVREEIARELRKKRKTSKREPGSSYVTIIEEGEFWGGR